MMKSNAWSKRITREGLSLSAPLLLLALSLALLLVGVLEGLYFHAVSYEKVYDHIKAVGQAGGNSLFLAILFSVPVVLWLFAAVAATLTACGGGATTARAGRVPGIPLRAERR